MDNDDPGTIPERTLETKLTKKADEQRTVKFCELCSRIQGERFLKERTKAQQLFSEWGKLQSLPRPSPEEQQAMTKIMGRMGKFQREHQYLEAFLPSDSDPSAG